MGGLDRVFPLVDDDTGGLGRVFPPVDDDMGGLDRGSLDTESFPMGLGRDLLPHGRGIDSGVAQGLSRTLERYLKKKLLHRKV